MKKYTVIYSDPPWSYTDKAHAGHRGAEYQYPCMTPEELKQLDVGQLSADDSALFLWATMPQLPVALDVMKAWGFTYKTVAFTWIKRTKNWKLFWGMGNWTRSNPELVLLGVRGRPPRVSKAVHSVVESEVREHSRKPDEVRLRIIELMGDVPRVEMFARPPIPEGWDVWGNAVESDVTVPRVKAIDLLSVLGAARRRSCES